MVKILIVTDNITQYTRVRDVFTKSPRNDLSVDYRHSPMDCSVWENIDGIEAIDVHRNVEWISTNYDLVISVHCLQFFPKNLVNNIRCINIHPGYNPINRGWYPQVFAIVHDLGIGATIHEMDEKLDNGPIIARELLTKLEWDTSEVDPKNWTVA